jgi:hypothetical protein
LETETEPDLAQDVIEACPVPKLQLNPTPKPKLGSSDQDPQPVLDIEFDTAGAAFPYSAQKNEDTTAPWRSVVLVPVPPSGKAKSGRPAPLSTRVRSSVDPGQSRS